MYLNRVTAPVLLGSSANILINYLFDPVNPDFFLKEFVVAICLCVPITELSHYIDAKLESKVSWHRNPMRRFLLHFLYLLIALVFSLDVLGNIYMWVVYDGFYTFDELLLINVVTFVMAILLTVLKWTTDFYLRWRNAERKLEDTEQKLNESPQNITQSTAAIDLQKGSSQIRVLVKDIRLAKIEHGIVRVYLVNSEIGLFQGSIKNLALMLPQLFFFCVGRNAIIHREAIVRVTPASYGKILLRTTSDHRNEDVLTVSRTKAASFRKWYKSSSA
jgi:hypothetical protein